jgi:xylan 1,4-beta-xylosidase
MSEKVIDLTKKGEMFYHFWSNCIGAGRANEGLRAEWQRQLKTTVQECGFRYIRFHGLLTDDMGVYRVENGVEKYNFAYIDMLFDFLLETCIRPIVEFGFMPEDMASGKVYQFWWKGNITPPSDYSAWGRLVSKLVLHWLERYGKEEVRKWYFEIWNEADLHVFWSGTKAQYFELYKTAVLAIKEIDRELRVGGPATSNFVPDDRFAGELEDFTKHRTHLVEDLQTLEWKGVWIEDFLKFCALNELPVDFVSTHPYPTDFAFDELENKNSEMKGRSRYVHSTRDDIIWLKNIVKNSAYPDAEIHLTEWSSSPVSRDYSHDYLQEAAFIIKCNLECIGLCDSLSYWVFTDIFEELGPGPELFHGGFGLMNMKGIRKPAYHAYHFLNMLGRYKVEQSDDYIITKTEDGKMRALFCHYPEEMQYALPIVEYPNPGNAEKIQDFGRKKKMEIKFRGMRPCARICMKILDKEHGNVTTLWKDMGYPVNPTRVQEKALTEYSEAFDIKEILADENGEAVLTLDLEPWNVVFVSEE